MGYNPSADIVRIAAAVEKAPSVFNTRPWKFWFASPDRIELRWPAGLDGLDLARAREYTISCGAALLNLRLAIRVAGHDLAVWLMPDPDHDPALVASVEVLTERLKSPTRGEQELYEAIWQRHTNRSPYIRRAPLPLIVAMEQAAAKEGGWLRLLHPRQARKWMRLAAEALYPILVRLADREAGGGVLGSGQAGRAAAGGDLYRLSSEGLAAGHGRRWRRPRRAAAPRAARTRAARPRRAAAPRRLAGEGLVMGLADAGCWSGLLRAAGGGAAAGAAAVGRGASGPRPGRYRPGGRGCTGWRADCGWWRGRPTWCARSCTGSGPGRWRPPRPGRYG